MSLVPRINFPINFCFWEGSFPTSKETKGRGRKREGGRERGREWRQDRHRRGKVGGFRAVALCYSSASTGHQSLRACPNRLLPTECVSPEIHRLKPLPLAVMVFEGGACGR